MERDMKRNQKNVSRMLTIHACKNVENEVLSLFERKEKEVEDFIRLRNGYSDAVFLAIHTEDKCWRDTAEVHRTDRTFPRILLMEKWNGKKGFIGGSVDANETLIKGLCREVKEECGYMLDDQQVHDNLNLLQINVIEEEKCNVYNFSLHLSREEVDDIIATHTAGRDYNDEVVGYSLQVIHKDNALLNPEYKNVFHGTGWKEFVALTEKIWKNEN